MPLKSHRIVVRGVDVAAKHHAQPGPQIVGVELDQPPRIDDAGASVLPIGPIGAGNHHRLRRQKIDRHQFDRVQACPGLHQRELQDLGRKRRRGIEQTATSGLGFESWQFAPQVIKRGPVLVQPIEQIRVVVLERFDALVEQIDAIGLGLDVAAVVFRPQLQPA